jgi:endonuclease/exonuclease/phosphatase family metal-dependent hydrolase
MTAFKVMNWNVENLFLPDPSKPETQQAFQDKLTKLAAEIDKEQPDVLALQEIGPNGALAALLESLTHSMPHAAEGDPEAGGEPSRAIRVGFLSTKPLSAIRIISPFPDLIRPVQQKDPDFDKPGTPADESLLAAMGRSALEVVVEVEGTEVTVITAHFKSKLISYPRSKGNFAPKDEDERYRYAAYALYRRTGEALTIRDRINAILSSGAGEPDPDGGLGREKAVVFCGDLNDQPDAATTQIIQGPSGSELETAGFRSGDKGDGYRMWNLAPRLNFTPEGIPPVEPPYTRVFKGRGELIDHIFASHRLVNPENIPEVRTVVSSGRLPSVNEVPTERKSDPASDHAAVVATFTI